MTDMELSNQVFEPQKVTLLALQDAGSIAPADAHLLASAVESRENIVISGCGGAGKTTLMQALLNERAKLFPGDRVHIVQCVAELVHPSAGVTRSPTGSVESLGYLIRRAMRMGPDTIALDEIRESSASELLDAWLSGLRGGFATIHAKDADSAMKRFADLVGQPSAEIRIKHAVKWVVHMTERRVTTVQLVRSDAGGFADMRWVAPGSGMSVDGGHTQA